MLPIQVKPRGDDLLPRAPFAGSASVPRLLLDPSWRGDQTPCFLISDWMNISRKLSCVECPEAREVGIRLKLGLISTIKHQLTYAPPWHCTRPTTTNCHLALSIRRPPVVRDGETGTSRPASAGKDGRYSSSGLRTGMVLCITSVNHFVPPHLLAKSDRSRTLHMCPREDTRATHHPSNSPRLDAGLPQHQTKFLQDVLTSLPAYLFRTVPPHDTFPHEPHRRALPARRPISYIDWP